MFASMDYPFSDERFGQPGRGRGARRRDATGRPAELGRAVREQRGRAAGRDAWPRHGTGPDPLLRRDVVPEHRRRGRARRDLRAVVAVRWRPADADRITASRTTTGSAAIAAPCPTHGPAASCSRRSAWPSRTSPTTRRWRLSSRNHPARRSSITRAGRRVSHADAGAGWDFDDLRDHYLEVVFGVHPGTLRRGNPDRYLELSRAVTGEVMTHVYGEWRRAGSPCGGGMILWLRDLVAGAGLRRRRQPGAAEDALSLPAPDPRADRRLAHRRGHRRRHRPHRQRRPACRCRRDCGSRSTRTSSCRSGAARRRSSCRPTAPPSAMSRPSSGISSTRHGPIASGHRPRMRSWRASSATERTAWSCSRSRSISRPGVPFLRSPNTGSASPASARPRRRWRRLPGRHEPPAGVRGADPRPRLRAVGRCLLGRAGRRPAGDAAADRDRDSTWTGGGLTALNLAGRVAIRDVSDEP